MSRMTMDRTLAYATSTDAANRQMRRAGRVVWNADDLALASDTQLRLLWATLPEWERGALRDAGLAPEGLQ